MNMANKHAKRLILTFLSPLIVHFYIPIPIVLVGFARRDFLLYVFLPIITAVTVLSNKISYGPIILRPTVHFTIPAIVLFILIFVSTILFAKRDRVWKILIFTVFLTSILHSLTPVLLNPYSGSGCDELVINFLDSRTVYCIRLDFARLSGGTAYYHVTVFPLESRGVLVTRIHLLSPKLVINNSEEIGFSGEGVYHAIFYAKNIHKAVLKFCYYPETIIGTLPVPTCENKILATSIYGDSVQLTARSLELNLN